MGRAVTDILERLLDPCYDGPLNAEAAREIKRLRAERLRLPLFADDVIAYPGMLGWFPGASVPGIVNETGLTCGNDEWGGAKTEGQSQDG